MLCDDYVTSFERNALNQYVAETLAAEGQPEQTRSYVYDANGNLLEDDIYRYTYKWRNAITAVHWLSDDQLVARYGYDAQGRRVSKYDATTGDSTRYIYDGWQVIEERDLANNLLARYTYSGLDTPVTMTRGEATYYYHTNHQGSVIALTGENGQVVVPLVVILGVFVGAYGIDQNVGMRMTKIVAYCATFPLSFVCLHVVLKLYFGVADVIETDSTEPSHGPG